MTDHDITRLPKWAQRQIRDLAADNTRLRKQLVATWQGPSTNVFLSTVDKPIPLPPRPIIFVFPDGVKITAYVDDREHADRLPRLRIHVSGPRGEAAIVEPVVSNGVNIIPADLRFHRGQHVPIDV